MFARYVINAIVRTEKAVVALALLAMLAAIGALLHTGLREDYRLEAFVATDDAAYRRFRDFMDEFTSNEFALLAIHSEKPFDDALESVLAEAAGRLAAVPGVGRAGALTDIPALLRRTLGDRLYAQPLLSGNLISEDRRTVAVLCRMEGERGDGAERRRTVAALRAVVEDLRARHGAYTFLLTGPYVTLIDMYAYVEHDLIVFSILAFVIMAAALALVFRAWPPMLYAAGVSACAILCTLGVTVAAGIVSSLITQMLVVLIIVLAVANCVQLAVAAQESVAALPEAPRQIRYRRTLAHMLAPCSAAIATTMAGFGSVGVSAIAPVRRFGSLMVLGLAIALVVGFAGAGWLHRGGARAGADQPRLAGWLAACARWTLRRRGWVAAGFVALIALAAPGFARLRFESDFVKNFRPDSEVRRSYRFIEQNLSPLGSVEIVVRRRDGGSIATAAAVRTAHQVGRSAVAEHELVRRALSLHDLLTLVLPAPPASDEDVRMRLAALQLWSSGGDLRRGFLNEAGDALRINLRCVEGFDVAEKLRVCRELEAEAALRFGPEYAVEVTGLYHFYAELVAGLLRDQYSALGITFAALTALVLLMLRSLRWTLIAMTVNVLPVVVCIGTMGWLSIPVNMTTAMMLAAAMGIAFDSLMHYVWRFRRERAAGADVASAVEAAHASIGRACVFTTLVMAGGFSILLLSEFLPTAYFGGLVGFTMVVALAGVLVLLPVLIAWFAPPRAHPEGVHYQIPG